MKSKITKKSVIPSDPVFTIPAEFIVKQLDRIANLDNITVEGIVEKARWLDRFREMAKQKLKPFEEEWYELHSIKEPPLACLLKTTLH